MDIDKIRHIHFVGIKGVGMTGLAIIAAEMGKKVTGSDVEEEFITQKALKEKKIKIFHGFDKNHITEEIDLVVTTGAHQGYENPEVEQARNIGVPAVSHAEALGQFMQLKRERISVSGTHGKTTTTAMIAHIVSRSGYDPAYLTGTGSINSLGLPAHWGKGDCFVAEADEYVTEPVHDHTSRFLWQDPTILVITNIEYDHPDVFPDIRSVQEAFRKLAKKVPADGVIIASIDSPETERALKAIDKRIIWYGYSPRANYRVVDSQIVHDSCDICSLEVGVGGKHNTSNALAALLAATEAGVSWQSAAKYLVDYTGSGRRFELIGKVRKTLLYDDYAHHPTEIRATLKMIREIYPEIQVTCVFQPHTYSRTKALFKEFAAAFENADKVILTDIFASAREQKDPTVDSKKLAAATKQYHRDVVYCPDLADVIEYLRPKIGEEQIIITMGAGDIYKINKSLLSASVISNL